MQIYLITGSSQLLIARVRSLMLYSHAFVPVKCSDVHRMIEVAEGAPCAMGGMLV